MSFFTSFLQYNHTPLAWRRYSNSIKLNGGTIMLKKSLLAILTTLLMVIAFVGIASADEGTLQNHLHDRGSKFAVGKIISIGTDQFTINTKNRDITLRVTEDTVFKNREGDILSFSDLAIGHFVAGRAGKDEEGNLIARLVILLPEDFDPQKIDLIRLKGVVEKVNYGQNIFELKTESGKIITIKVNDQTKFLGSVGELKDLEKGLGVTVGAIRNDEGILAKVVADLRDDQPRGSSAAGKVTAVDNNMLTIETKNSSLSFHIIGDTIFKSRGGDIDSLSDITVGMGVMVVYKTNGDGNLQALVVIAGDVHEGRPQVRKTVGEVTSINESQLSIINRNGEDLSFSIHAETKFVSRNDAGIQAADIQNGQTVLVVFSQTEDGSLIAKLVGVGQIQK